MIVQHKRLKNDQVKSIVKNILNILQPAAILGYPCHKNNPKNKELRADYCLTIVNVQKFIVHTRMKDDASLCSID